MRELSPKKKSTFLSNETFRKLQWILLREKRNASPIEYSSFHRTSMGREEVRAAGNWPGLIWAS